jgi:guanylate cyclase
MDLRPQLGRISDWLLHFGAYPEETLEQRAKRRLFLTVGWIATVLTIPTVFEAVGSGFGWVAGINALVVVLFVLLLVALQWKPRLFPLWVQLMLAIILVVESVVLAAVQGGLVASGVDAIFSVAIVVLILILFGTRTAAWWFVAFVASVVLTLLVPNWVDPLYVVETPEAEIAFNLVAFGLLMLLAMIYFVRERDRFQKESDDLLHNILPDDIAQRLKVDSALIADSFDAASVLFADMVNFTPMSAAMTPPQLIELLNDVFATFDGFVEELGLEKIRTVGDEYMVASGVPQARPDHAHAIAELALRIRDHTEAHQFDGHDIRLRIGINSGPLVAGVVGKHKFSYDLWGDVVNVASRMESEGIPGSIQVTEATYELIRDRFVCEPRGVISVKGKGEMYTYLLLSRNADNAVTP